MALTPDLSPELSTGEVESFGAVILAAGRGQRMGRSKPLLPWGDRTLLEAWVLRFRSLGIENITVVVGPDRDMIQAGLTDTSNLNFVLNPEAESTGARESLLLGLCALPEGQEAWFVPVDVPVVGTSAMQRVLKAYRQAKLAAGDGPRPLAALPSHRGHSGHPVLVGPDFVNLLAEGERGDRIDALFGWATRRLVVVDVDDIRVVGNMNRPVDYQAFVPPPGAAWDYEEPEKMDPASGIDALETKTLPSVPGDGTGGDSLS